VTFKFSTLIIQLLLCIKYQLEIIFTLLLVVQDVVLHVPMESMRDVERVKQALAIEGKSLHDVIIYLVCIIYILVCVCPL